MVLFVDPRCAEKRKLLAVSPDRVQTVMLTTQRDGIRQISLHMESRRPPAYALIAASEDASCIEIGLTRLTIPGLYAYETALRRIGSALAPGAVIQLLGRGRNRANDDILTAMLSKMTGVEVISSEVPAHLDEIWTASRRRSRDPIGCTTEGSTPPAASSRG